MYINDMLKASRKKILRYIYSKVYDIAAGVLLVIICFPFVFYLNYLPPRYYKIIDAAG